MVNEGKTRVREYTVAEIAERFKRGETFHFVDVREDDEWKAGRAKGTLHLGKGVIERDIETTITDKGADIVLYCGGGFRSILAAEALQKMGYSKVSSMDGGYREWNSADLPTEK